MIKGAYYYLSAQYIPLHATEAAFRLTKGSSKHGIAHRIGNFFKGAVEKYKTLVDFKRDFAVPVSYFLTQTMVCTPSLTQEIQRLIFCENILKKTLSFLRFVIT